MFKLTNACGDYLRRPIQTCAAALFACGVPLIEISAQSLDEALIAALESSPSISAANSAYNVTRQGVPIACGGYRPSLSLQAEGSINDFTITENNDDRSDQLQTNGIGLNLNQNLYAGGGTSADVRAARFSSQESFEDFISTRQDVMLEAITAYADVLRDNEVVAAARNNVERVEEQLSATQRRRNAGEATRTDVSQAEARLSGARASLASALATLEGGVAQFIRVIGQAPEGLGFIPLPSGLPATLDEATALIDNHPLLRGAQASVDAAQASVRGAQADLLPSLDLDAELSFTDEPTVLIDEQRFAIARLVLTVPLYQGGGEYAQLRQNKALKNQRLDELNDLRSRLEAALVATYRDLEASRMQVTLYEEQAASNQRALDGVKQEVLIGTRVTLDVLDAEQELFASRVNQARATRDETVAAYELLSLVGALEPDLFNIPARNPDQNNRCAFLDFSAN